MRVSIVLALLCLCGVANAMLATRGTLTQAESCPGNAPVCCAAPGGLTAHCPHSGGSCCSDSGFCCPAGFACSSGSNSAFGQPSCVKVQPTLQQSSCGNSCGAPVAAAAPAPVTATRVEKRPDGTTITTIVSKPAGAAGSSGKFPLLKKLLPALGIKAKHLTSKGKKSKKSKKEKKAKKKAVRKAKQQKRMDRDLKDAQKQAPVGPVAQPPSAEAPVPAAAAPAAPAAAGAPGAPAAPAAGAAPATDGAVFGGAEPIPTSNTAVGSGIPSLPSPSGASAQPRRRLKLNNAVEVVIGKKKSKKSKKGKKKL